MSPYVSPLPPSRRVPRAVELWYEERPLDADRLRALAADLAACGSVHTAAVARQVAAEVEGR